LRGRGVVPCCGGLVMVRVWRLGLGVVAPVMLGVMLAVVLGASPARAASDMTYVAGEGADFGICDVWNPCLTFAFAMGQTNAGGTINVEDSGNYGAVVINKALTIRSDSSDPVAIATIQINAAATDQVEIVGITFNGMHAGTPYPYGVEVTQAAQVFIDNCKFWNYGTSGQAGGAVYIAPVSFSRVTVNETQMFNNSAGVTITLASNAVAGSSAHLKIFHSFLSSNTDVGIRAIGTGNDALIENSQIFGSTKAIDLQNGGAARSYGDNVITNGDALIPVPLN